MCLWQGARRAARQGAPRIAAVHAILSGQLVGVTLLRAVDEAPIRNEQNPGGGLVETERAEKVVRFPERAKGLLRHDSAKHKACD